MVKFPEFYESHLARSRSANTLTTLSLSINLTYSGLDTGSLATFLILFPYLENLDIQVDPTEATDVMLPPQKIPRIQPEIAYATSAENENRSPVGRGLGSLCLVRQGFEGDAPSA